MVIMLVSEGVMLLFGFGGSDSKISRICESGGKNYIKVG